MPVFYKVRDCLNLCAAIQTQYKRWGKEAAIGELMRIAVLEEPTKAMVIAVCRLLFKSKTAKPLRPPGLGEPLFLGDTSAESWPLELIHFYEGVPFFIVSFWSIAGLSEPANWYLAHCLLEGVWNDFPYRMIEPEQLEVVANKLIENGPWNRSLTLGEQKFLLAQI